MRSVSLRVFFVLLATFVTASAFAHDVTLSGTTSFAAIDGSANDHDNAVNGVFTVNDGNLVVSGVVNCNDDSTESACAMAFAVSGNMTVTTAGALYAENRSGGGSGGAITLTVGGSLTMSGNAIVSTASRSSSGSGGGAITANVTGNVTIGNGSTIDSGSANAAGGNLTIASAGLVSIDGNVLSGPSRTILSTRLTGAALDGGTANQVGGQITIGSSTFVEPAIVIGGNANIISQGGGSGAGPVVIDGCGVQVRGLVAALSRNASAAKVAIRSGKDVLIDSRDLGVVGAPLGRNGRVRADAPTGTAINKGVDVFAAETIDIHGASGSLFSITSHPGVHDSKSYGGLIRITSLGDAITASGNVIDAGHSAAGDTGGTVEINAKATINLDSAVIRAIGDFNTNNPNRGGGSIRVRSYSGDVVWTNGTGEVRPVGSSSNLPLADQGTIVLTACGTVNTTGSTFPVMGTATSMFPETHTGVCSPAAPSLPTGVAPLVTCNTPPVANDSAASTNEDNSVTVTMTGTDADGDSLTFSVVSGPFNGSVGAVTFVNATTSTVVYTPNLNYNGVDSFVFQANDGNGGTDNGTATITIAPVNDAPVFLVGPTVTVLEDAGPQTYTNWATGISGGPADESGQVVTFTVTNDNPSLFSVQPAVSSNGTLTYTPAANAYGSANLTVTAQDNGGTANGGVDTSAPQNSSITVTPVNDEPSFVKGADQTVNEDAGPQSVAGWATAISAGPNEGAQTVTFNLSNTNNSLFSVQPAVSSNGTLTYTPAANANGSATVTIEAQDDGGTANGGDNTSPSQTFVITVNAVNDAPSFTSGGDVSVLEDSGAYSANWATAISAGPADESSQTVTFNTSNDNNSLFSVQPSISPTGVLTFTLASNAFGSANVSVTLSDNGGTANGGVDTSAAQTFSITVGNINDEPTFTAGGDVTVNEDSGAYSAAWASAISAGPNETDALTFVVTNDNNGLFSSQPSISASGVLSFTPAANAFGSAVVSVTLTDDGGTLNGGDDTSSTVTFTITVNSVNDAPSFTSGGNVSVGEDSGAYSAAWATAISAGPANESTQTVSFITSNNNNALFSVQPSVDSNGVLTFTPAANATGTATITIYAQDTGGTANGGVDVSASQTFTISVNGINDPPSFTPGADQTSNEDAGPQTVVGWATGISSGPGETDNVTFFTSNNNPSLFSSQPTVAPNGTLTYTAAPDANGTATVTIYAQDDGGTANGGNDTSATYTFTITIVAVNDPPSFTGGGNVSVLEDSGAYSATWATAISAGPADEAGQTLTFNVTNDNNSLFSVQPSISASGVLSFTVAANAFGSANVTVTLSDGLATTAPQSFTITVGAVNDAPSFVGGGDVTVNEDSGPYSASWASSISAGPNEGSQTVSFNTSNNNNSLFLVQPSISSTGVLSFTPALNAFGSATVTVTLSDNGGTANGGVNTSAPQTFTINVTATNDGPTANADSWQTIGNTELRVDLVAGLTPYVGDTTPSGNGVRDNDTDPEGDPTIVTGVVGCGDTTAPFDCTLGSGAKVSMLANGSFSYTPAPGTSSGTFQYTATDIPSAGSPVTTTGTVTITHFDMVWYVNGAALPGGNGTSSSPFNGFTSLNGIGDVDGPGHTIFVHTSAVAGSIALETSQKLWGQGVGLSLPYNLNGNGSPTVLVAPGIQPTVTSAADVVTVSGVIGTEIAGLNLASTGGNAVDVTAAPFGSPAGASIYSNTISGAGAEGIDVSGGHAMVSTVSINNNTITSTGNGIDVSSFGSTNIAISNTTITSTGGSGIRMDGTGSLTVSALQNITVSGNTAANGIEIADASFTAVATGAITVGASGNPVGGAGVVLTNSTGSLAFGTLTVHAATTGVTVSGTAAFNVTSGGGSINNASGAGLNISNATIGAANFNLTSITSAGGANGIVLNNTGTAGGLNVTGSGSAGTGGSITGKTGDGVSLTNTQRVGLAWMSISGSASSGIRGNGVNGFVVDNSTITGNGSSLANDDSGINIVNLTGSLAAGTRPTAITNSTISNNYEFEVQITNSTGTLPDFRITNSTISSNGATGVHGNLVNFLATGTASMTLNASGGSYTGNAPATATAIQADASGGTVVANVSGATFTTNNVGVSVSVALGGTLTFDVNGNTLTGTRSHGLNYFIAGNHTGTSSGKFRNNVIGTFGVAGSGSALGFPVRVQNEAVSAATVLIDNNTISESSFNAINVNVAISTSTGTATTAATITNNLIRNVTANRAIIVQHTFGKGTICADIAGNSMSGIAGSAGDGSKIRIRQLAGGTFNVKQKQATVAVDPAELDDANSVGLNITTAAQVSTSGIFNYNAGGCPQP